MKEKISITLNKNLVQNIDSRRMDMGLSRSAYINMQLMKRRKR